MSFFIPFIFYFVGFAVLGHTGLTEIIAGILFMVGGMFQAELE